MRSRNTVTGAPRNACITSDWLREAEMLVPRQGRRDDRAVGVDDADAGERHAAHFVDHRVERAADGGGDRLDGAPGLNGVGRLGQDAQVGHVELREERGPAVGGLRRGRDAPLL